MLMPLSASAASNDFAYIYIDEYDIELSENVEGFAVVRYYGDETDIVIPSRHEGYPVIAIYQEAFKEKGITSVTIPNSIMYISDYVFYGNKLSEISIPDSVKKIGSFAFASNELTKVTIPERFVYKDSSDSGGLENPVFNNNKISLVNGEASNGLFFQSMAI